MNMDFSRVVRLLGVVLGFSATLCAEEPASPAASVTFTAFAWDVFDTEKDLAVNYQQKGKTQTLEIAWRDRSVAAACDGPGTLVFTQTVVRDGKSTEMPVATAEIPVGVKRVLLVFGRNTQREPGAMPYRVMVIDDSYAVFPGQSVRFINHSSVEMAGSLGEQVFTVAAGREQVVSATLSVGGQLLSLRLARRDAAGGWRKLRSTMLPMSAGQRVLVFLIDNPATPGRPEMVMVRDRVELEPPLPAQGGTLSKAVGLRVNPAGR
ncbi:MAG: hypothetical protein ABW223_04230 [Rariglobus sp.]